MIMSDGLHYSCDRVEWRRWHSAEPSELEGRGAIIPPIPQILAGIDAKPSPSKGLKLVLALRYR